MDLLGRIGIGSRDGEAIDLQELPAARIEQSQNDVSRLLVGHHVDVVARLDGDLQDGRALTGEWGGRGFLPAPTVERGEQEQCKA